MTRSETIIKIAPALAAAQASIGAASKDAANPFFKTRYADLGSVMAVCKEPLLANGIAVLQLVGTYGSQTCLETILLHSSGEFISDTMLVTVSKERDPQSMGSAITYARRYALQSMLFIPSVDDDAEWAKNAQERRPAPEVNAEALKSAVEAAGAKVIEAKIEPVSPNDTPKDWREVKCHIGKAGGPWLGKKLGEIKPKALKALYEDWYASKVGTGKLTGQDAELFDALSRVDTWPAAETHAKAPETPQEAPKPEKATDTPKPEEKPATVNSEQSPATPAKSTKFDWRKVKVHFGRGLKGRELGTVTDAELINSYVYGISKITTGTAEERDENKDEAFVAGVNAGMKEKALISPEVKKRRDVMMRLFKLGKSAQDATALLVSQGALEEKDTLTECSEAMLDYVIEHWTDLEAALTAPAE